MGKGLARNIIAKKSPQTKVYLYDTNIEHLDNFVNSLATTYDCKEVYTSSKTSDALVHSDLVALSLPSEKVLRSVLFDERSGMATRLARETGGSSIDRLVMDHSTTSRQSVLETHAKARELGVYYMDAPVSGGPQGAESGTLSVMYGVHDDLHASASTSTPSKQRLLFNQALDAMGWYSATAVRMGDVGAGMAAKLVNQALVGMHAQAAVEAYQLAKTWGLEDVAQLRELLQASWGHSK
eukprot:gene39893-48578_t